MAARAARATAIGARPDAPLKGYKPKTPSLRHRVVVDKRGLWPGGPVESLISRVNCKAGRGPGGWITIRGRCAPKHRRMYRRIDFKRWREDPAVVQRFEYDPNRSAFIALIQYQSDNALSYILAPHSLRVGDVVQCGEEAPFSPGNALPLSVIPDGTLVHNIELYPKRGGALIRAAGSSAKLISKEPNYAVLRMQSGELRRILIGCKATIGEVSNPNHQHRVLGKAGASRWIGRRPKVRGVAMNAVDHPMGGGEGKSSGRGSGSYSPWGWYTKGIRTRKTGQHSSKLIIKRRNAEKLGLATVNRGSW